MALRITDECINSGASVNRNVPTMRFFKGNRFMKSIPIVVPNAWDISPNRNAGRCARLSILPGLYEIQEQLLAKYRALTQTAAADRKDAK